MVVVGYYRGVLDALLCALLLVLSDEVIHHGQLTGLDRRTVAVSLKICLVAAGRLWGQILAGGRDAAVAEAGVATGLQGGVTGGIGGDERGEGGGIARGGGRAGGTGRRGLVRMCGRVGDEELESALFVAKLAAEVKKLVVGQGITDSETVDLGAVYGKMELVLVKYSELCKDTLADKGGVRGTADVDTEVTLGVCGDEDEDAVGDG
ncbi:hypothetical protein DFH09DRAFT_1132076 [Mycena vulgaris]|nr:hypothetical protein DFH09DRAFT_1132076 [Mycena vulgaris]